MNTEGRVRPALGNIGITLGNVEYVKSKWEWCQIFSKVEALRPCDIAACNCGGYHDLSERLMTVEEIAEHNTEVKANARMS